MVDTINILDFNRNAVGKLLIDMDMYFAPEIFVRRATPFDKLKDVPEGESTWKCEDLAVDAIFSQMLRLPTPEHKLVYYHSLITETCRIAPAAIAPSLGRAIRFLYRSMDAMDLELGYRFMDWFAQHLSNFDFRWKWAEWLDDVSLSPLYPKKAFILGVLDKEVRLSFARRIRETLPEEYHRLIPAKKDNDIPDFKYNDAATPFSAEGKDLLALIRRKAPDEEVEAAMSAFHTAVAAADPSLADPTPVSTDAFVTAICHIGSKSLSHVLSFIERYRSRLLALNSDAARIQIIASVVAYWQDVQPGVAVNISDKLLNYSVVAPADVCRWALASQPRLRGGALLAEHWVYELVAGTIAKVSRRVRQVALARLNDGAPLAPAPAAQLDATLAQERDGLQTLVASVDAALGAVIAGSSDALRAAGDDAAALRPLAFDDGHDAEPDQAEVAQLLALWGNKWARVFRRMLAVEQAWMRDVVARFPPPGEDVPVPDADAEEDGAAAEETGPAATTEEDLLM